MASTMLSVLLLALACAVGARAAEPINETLLSADDIPAERPPLWPFREMSSGTVTCADGKSGSIVLTVVHAPIPNVTPDMLTWLFLNGLRQSSVHPTDGKTYSNFMLMHPREHNTHSVSGKSASQNAAKGDETNWAEFVSTGCVEAGGNVWSCPKAPDANPGITKGNATTEWEKIEQTKGASTIAAISKISSKYLAAPTDPSKSGKAGKVTFQVKGCKTDDKGKEKCYPKVIQTTHTWKATGNPSGIVLTTVMTIGVNSGAKGARDSNPKILDKWRNGQDAKKKCYRAGLHFIEEYGALEHWLAGAWAQRA
ncbi:MAG: hypothetical protein J3K34DRAFT_443586 [Monoraphidium minutum]|nr:MAG: hypothetical protein J3K34DRAFT_443586 [Monoraphidium minutum]